MKCLTSCPGFRKTTELHNLSDYTSSTPRSAEAKFHDFFPLRKTLQTDFEISSKTTMPECHANLLLTETPCQLLEKATLARIMFNWLTKILWILDWRWVYLTVLTEGELCLDFQWSHNNSPVADRHMLHFFTGHINFSFNLFIRVGIKKLSAELGRGLPKDYTAVSYWDTCLGCTLVGGVELEYSWPNYPLNLSVYITIKSATQVL